MITIADAIRIRNGISKAVPSLEDIDASSVVELFPRLKADGHLIEAGTRINWNGVVKRASTDLWDTLDNNPDNALNLWEDIKYREGYRIISEVITAAGAFAFDEEGWWRDGIYKSTIDNNVWTPEQYPEGWTLIRQNTQSII